MENTNEEKTYKVYKHTLLKKVSGKNNDMIYIGITSIEPEQRWRNGLGYYQNKHFYNAIKKYGWNNFKHEILYTELTKKEAEQKEIELIAFYDSTDRKLGYNNDNGGNSTGKHSERTKNLISISNGTPIMCIETNELYHSVTEAMKITGIKTIRKHLLGEYKFAGKLSDGTKLHWKYCDDCNYSNDDFNDNSIAMSTFCLVVNGIPKKATKITYDELILLFNNFIILNGRTPLMRECTLENNLPQQRIINKIIKENNVTYNDFMFMFGNTYEVKSSVDNYNDYVEKFKNICNKEKRCLTQKELSNNSYGLPSVMFFVKHCPDINVKNYTDFIKWCGLKPSVKYYDKEKVGNNLIELENKLNRKIKASDITVDNCGFSYTMIKKYFGNLTNAKNELGLIA